VSKMLKLSDLKEN